MTVTLETHHKTRVDALTHEGYSIELAEATLESIELRKSCDAGGVSKTEGPFKLNLLASDEVSLKFLGAGTYCRAKMEFGEAGRPKKIWLHVEGKLPDDTPFVIQASRTETFTFDGRDSFVLEAEGADLNLRFDG